MIKQYKLSEKKQLALRKLYINFNSDQMIKEIVVHRERIIESQQEITFMKRLYREKCKTENYRLRKNILKNDK